MIVTNYLYVFRKTDDTNQVQFEFVSKQYKYLKPQNCRIFFS